MISLIAKYKKEAVFVLIIISAFFIGLCNREAPDIKGWEKEKKAVLDSLEVERTILTSKLISTTKQRDSLIVREEQAMMFLERLEEARSSDRLIFKTTVSNLTELRKKGNLEVQRKMQEEYEKYHSTDISN